SSGRDSDGPIMDVPALFTRTSRRFHFRRAAAARCSPVDASRTSPATAMASCPSPRSARATRSPRSSERELITRRAPSRAYAQAIASPMPMLDPVIAATWPPSRMSLPPSQPLHPCLAARRQGLGLPDGVDAPFRQQIGRPVRGDPFFPGDANERGHRLQDPRDIGHGALPVEPAGVETVRVEDRSPGVDDVVRSVQDAPGMDVLAVPLLPELIVRGAADDLDPEPRERLGVDDAAQRAGTEDVGRQGGDLIWRRGGDGISARDRLDLFAVDVAHHDAGAGPD